MKKMKNILFVLTLCAIFILSACQEAPPAELESFASIECEVSSQDESTTRKPLSGKSLESAQYTIQIPKDIQLNNDYLLSDSYSIMTVTSDDYDFTLYLLNGDCTILNLHFSYINGAEQIPIMYLQAFDLTNYDNETKYIKINDKLYDTNQLESDIVYQDSRIIIYNLYPYIKNVSFEDFLQQSIDEINTACNESDLQKDSKNIKLNFDDYSYLLDAETYINQNISSFITPIKNTFAEENTNSVESEESSEQNSEQDQTSESQSINQTNSSECSSTTQNITKSESFSSEVQDVTVDETEQLDPHDMFHYLEKNLDKNDYGYLNWLEDCTVCIYVVNEQAVKDVVDNYDKPPVEIEYIPFKYSIVQMENIIEELYNSDIIQQSLNDDTDKPSVIIHLDFFKPGVLVQWRDEIPKEFVDFMETYPYRDCVEYHEGIVNPC